MNEIFKYIVEDLYEGNRIDKFLVGKLKAYTRAHIQQSIKKGHVLVNDHLIKANYKLKLHDQVTGYISQKEEVPILPEDIPLNIIYEDHDIILVNKEPGMVVHPAIGNESGTLVNALLHHTKGGLSSLNGDVRPGIVHRIDKDTSGLIMVAKNNAAHEKLAQMLHDYEVTRKYHAIVFGNIKEDEGFVDAPIGRHPVERTKMAVTQVNSRDALTFYKVIQRFKGFTYLELTLHTGRTHQIRVHMQHIGHPILGDPIYVAGPKKQPYRSSGLFLHAKELGFLHPATDEYIEFDCQLPLGFQKVIDRLSQI